MVFSQREPGGIEVKSYGIAAFCRNTSAGWVGSQPAIAFNIVYLNLIVKILNTIVNHFERFASRSAFAYRTAYLSSADEHNRRFVKFFTKRNIVNNPNMREIPS